MDKIKEDEEDIFNKNLAQLANQKPAKTIPPPPILLKRSATYMMLKPGPFEPSSGQTVAWYRIFAKQITGPDAKVRLNDNLLNGTGIEVWHYPQLLRISEAEIVELMLFFQSIFFTINQVTLKPSHSWFELLKNFLKNFFQCRENHV